MLLRLFHLVFEQRPLFSRSFGSSFVTSAKVRFHGSWPCAGHLPRRTTERFVGSQRQIHAQAVGGRKRLVFLGTPEVAAESLETILREAAKPETTFQVVGIVTQPGRPQGRGSKRTPRPSPVETVANEAGLARQNIFCPESAKEAAFLDSLRALQPDLCVTAAYGNILPQKFLDIPAFGTLNIHPSLLPAYRGAAPVQRAIINGESRTGVSVAFTVRAMDAGPVLAQQSCQIDDAIQAPQLLRELFHQGTELLLSHLTHVWTFKACEIAQPQDEAATSHAAKLTKADSMLDFREPAKRLHDKVRGQAGWPGTTHTFLVRKKDGTQLELELKVLATQLARDAVQAPHLGAQHVQVDRSSLLVWCGDGCALELLQVQPAGRKPMSAQAFANGLTGSTLLWQEA